MREIIWSTKIFRYFYGRQAGAGYKEYVERIEGTHTRLDPEASFRQLFGLGEFAFPHEPAADYVEESDDDLPVEFEAHVEQEVGKTGKATEQDAEDWLEADGKRRAPKGSLLLCKMC